MSTGFYVGMPGMSSATSASHRRVFRSHGEYLTSGRVINGAQSRDPGSSPVGLLRAGLLMGQLSTGLWAPSIVGVTTEAYTSGGTELTVSAAQAVELLRLVGASGTTELVAIGPPTAAGTVAVTAVTHSAIDVETGVLTVTDLAVDKVAGTLIAVNDSRYTPRTFIPDNGYGVKVTDENGDSVATVDFPKMPIYGEVISAQLLPVWPSDTSIQAWIIGALNAAAGGKMVFDHHFSV